MYYAPIKPHSHKTACVQFVDQTNWKTNRTLMHLYGKVHVLHGQVIQIGLLIGKLCFLI